AGRWTISSTAAISPWPASGACRTSARITSRYWSICATTLPSWISRAWMPTRKTGPWRRRSCSRRTRLPVKYPLPVANPGFLYPRAMASTYNGGPCITYLWRIGMLDGSASVERNTSETQIKVEINLDGTGQAHFDIGVPFLEHMLDQVARHGLIDMHIECRGDLHIDDHHTVEDVGITLGQAFARAVGDKKGLRRY